MITKLTNIFILDPNDITPRPTTSSEEDAMEAARKQRNKKLTKKEKSVKKWKRFESDICRFKYYCIFYLTTLFEIILLRNHSNL